MKISYIVLSCVLFTTAASLSLTNTFEEYYNDSVVLEAQSRSCQCENGRCFTNKQGQTKCACNPGYALYDEYTCKPCDCGSLGRCIFVLSPTSQGQLQHRKKCVCDVGHAEKDGICVNCFCGINSACDFDYGERRCYCMEGFSERYGVCTKCDCGFYGQCEFDGSGNKKCECDEGYLEMNGICEACDCGPNARSCDFRGGVKQCNCLDRFADKFGTCEECFCGPYTSSCKFIGNQKTCSCFDGYVQKRESCEPGCSARNPCQNGGFCREGFCFCQKGTRGEFCEEIDECSTLCPSQLGIKCAYDIELKRAFCKCLDNNYKYDPLQRQCRPTCNVMNPCQNGGYCREGVCFCRKGTRGEFCEDIDGCSTLCPNQPEVKCCYDIETQKAYCQCLDNNMKYNPLTRQCRPACNAMNPCQNGGFCKDGSCFCQKGTSGDYCDVIDECSYLCPQNQLEIKCAYDITSKKAFCKCLDNNLKYNPYMKQCRPACNAMNPCQNGGLCREGSCFCLKGTSGEFCDVIDGCSYLCPNNQIDIKCSYDVITKSAYCRCLDNNLKYDSYTKQCRQTCSAMKPCQNGGFCREGFCFCQKGTSGEFCDVIDDCATLCPMNQVDIKCSYDVISKSAYCKCLDSNMKYDPNIKHCRQTCNALKPCQNGGLCREGFCNCLTGTSGEFCDVIDGCAALCPNNQAGIKCSYDVGTKSAYCRCLDSNLKFDPNMNQCRRTCDRTDECGRGVCMNNFCDCLPATKGDRCEIFDCPSGVFNCEHNMHALWWGGDTMFLFQGQGLLRFQSIGGGHNCDTSSSSRIKCEQGLDIYWGGRDTLCIPWKKTHIISFRRQDSSIALIDAQPAINSTVLGMHNAGDLHL